MLPPMSSRLAGADAFWLRAESPSNRMVICGFLALEGALSLDTLKARLAPHLGTIPGFRRAVDLRAGEPRWADADDFDPDRHFSEIHVPPGSGDEALMAVLEALIPEPLPAERPLWGFVLVQGLASGSVVVARFHHCLADGIALVALLLSLTTPLDDAVAGTASTDLSPPEDPLMWARDQVDRAQAIVRRGRRFLGHLGPAALRARGLELRDASRKLASLSPQDHPAFKARLGTAKRVTWSPPLPLEPMKAMARAVDGKLNDVLLALVCGALRRFTEARGTPLQPGESLRATVPVNLRPLEVAHELGNRFGLLFVDLPVTTVGVEARLAELKRQMDVLKQSSEPLLTFGIMRAVGWGPPELQDQLVDLFSRRTSLVLSNVPGPRRRLAFAGRPLRRVMFWVPQSGSVSLGLSLISYAGELMLGINADRGLFPDAAALARALYEEHDHMAEVLGIPHPAVVGPDASAVPASP